MAYMLAGLELASRHVAEGARRVVDQQRPIAEQMRAGRDTCLSIRVLENFYSALQLLIERRNIVLRDLGKRP